MTDEHGHEHYASPRSRRARSEFELRTMALEALLVERGLASTDAIDKYVEYVEKRLGPHHGARVVARAWVDPEFRSRLLADGTAAAAELGIGGIEGARVRVVANGPDVHHLVVCTLCSCYPWSLLGAPPLWYKSFAYRSRAVAEPRAVLREFGVELGPEVEVKVWDSTSETRYLVLPERPAGTEGWTEEALAGLVSRDAMIGAGRAGSAS
ncbi:nitrile hydratase subunit alpha [Streptomyces sp. NPDC056190]|uniref:nitrile hydratase subunit alpha n=1 Tax=unclassified Streptomyces TaxID=2593676 RepID=UPI0035DBD746